MNPFAKPTALQLAEKELAEAERYLLQAHTSQETWASEVRRREQQIIRLTQFIESRRAPTKSGMDVGSGEYA